MTETVTAGIVTGAVIGGILLVAVPIVIVVVRMKKRQISPGIQTNSEDQLSNSNVEMNERPHSIQVQNDENSQCLED